jgi:hypothetical protein
MFPQMLEISTRPWLYSLSQKYGKPISRLSDIPQEELEQIVKQKYDIVWCVPCLCRVGFLFSIVGSWVCGA